MRSPVRRSFKINLAILAAAFMAIAAFLNHAMITGDAKASRAALYLLVGFVPWGVVALYFEMKRATTAEGTEPPFGGVIAVAAGACFALAAWLISKAFYSSY
jgi:hypothetical protein